MTRSHHTVFLTSPLEEANVARLREVCPDRLTVLYEPALMPELRYTADHKGVPKLRSAAQIRRFRDRLSQADILFDLPSAEDLPFCPNLRWVQTTSTGIGPSVARLGLDKSDVLVTTARGVHAGPLAEFTFMALLAHFRGLAHLQGEQRAHAWNRYCGVEVASRTLVTIGAGDLACGVARIAQALRMRVIAIARDATKTRPDGLFDEVLPVTALHEALARPMPSWSPCPTPPPPPV